MHHNATHLQSDLVSTNVVSQLDISHEHTRPVQIESDRMGWDGMGGFLKSNEGSDFEGKGFRKIVHTAKYLIFDF